MLPQSTMESIHTTWQQMEYYDEVKIENKLVMTLTNCQGKYLVIYDKKECHISVLVQSNLCMSKYKSRKVLVYDKNEYAIKDFNIFNYVMIGLHQGFAL